MHLILVQGLGVIFKNKIKKMKTIILVLCLSTMMASAQQEYKLFTKKDIKVLPLVFAAGYTTGLREEVIQHPKQFMLRHSNLNSTFWDNRVQGKKRLLNMEWNADHVLKGTTALLFTAAITFNIGEKKKWYFYLADGIKNYLFYKIGFYVSYHFQEKNKL